MHNPHFVALACAALAGAAAPALAMPPTAAAARASASAAPVPAEVRKIDLAQFKLTLRHGPLPNLDMPPMTMVFEVPDPADRATLRLLKPGQKLLFQASQSGGALVARQLVPQP